MTPGIGLFNALSTQGGNPEASERHSTPHMPCITVGVCKTSRAGSTIPELYQGQSCSSICPERRPVPLCKLLIRLHACGHAGRGSTAS